VRYRLVSLDAPEIQSAKCAAERHLGIIAAARLLTLMAERGAELVPQKGRDKYGRGLARLQVGGEDWATIASPGRTSPPPASTGSPGPRVWRWRRRSPGWLADQGFRG
jgi:hypothetical protein